jgi:inorganic pyrophosphatase
MPITKLLQEPKKFEVQLYDTTKKAKDLRQTHVPFAGSPCKHPYDRDKFILIVDPYSSNTFYYEFDSEDVEYAKELPSIVNVDGETVNMALIWVKKNSIAQQCTPFVVQDTSTGGKE